MHSPAVDPERLSVAAGAERARLAKATAPPRDPGGVWRAMLAQLPGVVGGALIDEWTSRADARHWAGAPIDIAERLAYEDIAAIRREA